MAGRARRRMIQVPLSEVRDHLSEFVKKAETEEVVVTVHGHPAAVIIGFEDEDDWLEYQLLNNEDFQSLVAESRKQYQEGKYITLDELP